jgi:hypothetical protein
MRKENIMAKNRSIALAIIFTIFTCGIYGIYWFIVLTDDMNRLTLDDDYQMSGAVSFLLSLVTCGIYGIYWAYKMGNKVDRLNGGSYTGFIYILLHLFGLEIINLALMQDTVNCFATVPAEETATYIEYEDDEQ